MVAAPNRPITSPAPVLTRVVWGAGVAGVLEVVTVGAGVGGGTVGVGVLKLTCCWQAGPVAVTD